MARLTERLLVCGRQQVDYTSPVTPAGRPMSHRIVRREPFADLAADLAADPAKWKAGRPVERRRRQRRLRPGQCEPLKDPTSIFSSMVQGGCPVPGTATRIGGRNA